MLIEWLTSILKKITLNLNSAISEPPTAEIISLIPFGCSTKLEAKFSPARPSNWETLSSQKDEVVQQYPTPVLRSSSAGHCVMWLSTLFLFGSLPFPVLVWEQNEVSSYFENATDELNSSTKAPGQRNISESLILGLYPSIKSITNWGAPGDSVG